MDLNLGTSYRRRVGEDSVLGFNASALFRKEIRNAENTHTLGSFGVDYQKGASLISANLYVPLSEAQFINRLTFSRVRKEVGNTIFYDEKVAGGLDLEYRKVMSDKIIAKGGVRYFLFEESEDDNPLSLKGGAKYIVNCRVSVDSDLEYFKEEFHDDLRVSVGVQVLLGKMKSRCGSDLSDKGSLYVFSKDNKDESYLLVERIEKVERIDQFQAINGIL